MIVVKLYVPELAGCRLSTDAMECKDLLITAVLEALPTEGQSAAPWEGLLPASLLWAPDLQQHS